MKVARYDARVKSEWNCWITLVGCTRSLMWAGLFLVNGVSEGACQIDSDGQRTKSKSFPGFAPVGP